MSKLIIFIFIVLCTLSNGRLHAQSSSTGGELVTVLFQPKNYTGPSALIISSNEKYLAVCFAYMPSKILIYEINNWDNIKELVVPGYVFAESSYFDPNDEQTLYLSTTLAQKKFKKINLRTGESSKVKCEITPFRCDYKKAVATRLSSAKNTLFFQIKETRIFVYKSINTK